MDSQGIESDGYDPENDDYESDGLDNGPVEKPEQRTEKEELAEILKQEILTQPRKRRKINAYIPTSEVEREDSEWSTESEPTDTSGDSSDSSDTPEDVKTYAYEVEHSERFDREKVIEAVKKILLPMGATCDIGAFTYDGNETDVLDISNALDNIGLDIEMLFDIGESEGYKIVVKDVSRYSKDVSIEQHVMNGNLEKAVEMARKSGIRELSDTLEGRLMQGDFGMAKSLAKQRLDMQRVNNTSVSV